MPTLSSAVAPGAHYLLPTDDKESYRLDLQHQYLKHAVYDDRLIYDTSVHIPVDGRVLDAGTGSGSWILDLAEVLPQSVRLDGIDVSTTLYPITHAENIAFSRCSITSLPAAWAASFDFANQRLLTAGLRTTEWPLAVAEIFRVLKPGGHVQFAEVNLHWEATSAASRTYQAVLSTLFERLGLLIDLAVHLPRMLTAAGFVDVRLERKITCIGAGEGEYGVMGKQSFSGAFRGIGAVVMKQGGLGFFGSERDFHELIDTIEAEWDRGISNRLSYDLVCALKPR